MSETRKKSLLKHYGIKLLAVCFWLLLWQLLSIKVANKILLASPLSVLATLKQMVGELSFWQTIGFSFLRIITGFLLAIVVGIFLAVISHQSMILKEFIMPIMKVIKSIPVASFIILALVWIQSKNLSVLIAFLMVLPIIYSNIVQGLATADEKLLQMAKVFRVSSLKKIHAIYIPSVMPYFISAISVGLGFCWKAGIAAEVIGNSAGSIGRQLLEAKLYLMTKELFAWTIVIIIISVVFERLILRLLQGLTRLSKFNL